jgi:hypothetical protein
LSKTHGGIAEHEYAENQEVDLDTTDEIEVEIQDDTPEEDRGRPRKAESESESDTPAVEEDDDDADLGKHSESVQKRIKKLKFEYHEERRRKETADREREAAVQYAQQIKGENDRLRKNLNEGESVLITQAKARIASELVGAKAAYKAAYEAGDADAVLNAQEKLMKLQNESSRVDNWTPPKQQAQAAPVPQATHVPEPDPRAKAWVEKNSWFNEDRGMQRYAMLIHEELIENGVDSTSNSYYSRIDAAMRQRYPDRFDDAPVEVRQPQRQAGSVVAPGGRNTPVSRHKVVISSSEAAIAKRLGLSIQQYAAQKLKDIHNG